MAARKKTKTQTKRATSPSFNLASSNDLKEASTSNNSFSKKIKKIVNKKTITVIAVAAVLAGAAFYFKEYLVAAMVNGQPISRWSVVRDLEKRNGQQALDSIITQTLISQEAKNKNINVSPEEIEAETKKLEDSLKEQGQDLETALAAQGMTRDVLKNQIMLQKMIEKILGNDIKVEDKEITEYISKNKDLFPKDMKEEDLKKNVEEQLKQQKLAEKFQSWISEVKQKANIQYFVSY